MNMLALQFLIICAQLAKQRRTSSEKRIFLTKPLKHIQQQMLSWSRCYRSNGPFDGFHNNTTAAICGRWVDRSFHLGSALVAKTLPFHTDNVLAVPCHRFQILHVSERSSQPLVQGRRGLLSRFYFAPAGPKSLWGFGFETLSLCSWHS